MRKPLMMMAEGVLWLILGLLVLNALWLAKLALDEVNPIGLRDRIEALETQVAESPR